MKASKLIDKLKWLIARSGGDVEVYMLDEEMGYPQGVEIGSAKFCNNREAILLGYLSSPDIIDIDLSKGNK